MKKNIVNTIIVSLVIACSLYGCIEPRYGQENHRQNRGHNNQQHRESSHREDNNRH